jgi:hypothetical protein
MLDNRPEELELQAPHPSGGFSLAAFERAEMNHWPLRTSGYGT